MWMCTCPVRSQMIATVSAYSTSFVKTKWIDRRIIVNINHPICGHYCQPVSRTLNLNEMFIDIFANLIRIDVSCSMHLYWFDILVNKSFSYWRPIQYLIFYSQHVILEKKVLTLITGLLCFHFDLIQLTFEFVYHWSFQWWAPTIAITFLTLTFTTWCYN